MEQRIIPDLPLEPVMDPWVLGEPDKGAKLRHLSLYRPGFFLSRVIEKFKGAAFARETLFG
jgi:hypothetical protein